jgi:altronate dehydratase small subunit
MKRAIQINPDDNVATTLADLAATDMVAVVSAEQKVIQEIKVPRAISFGHKLATQTISKGQHVIKYGEIIGVAAADIAVGEHAHVHNVNSARY